MEVEERDTRIIPVIGAIITVVLGFAYPKFQLPTTVVGAIGTVSAYAIFLSDHI